MIDNTIFKISQLTLPVATMLATAWVAVEKSGEAAFWIFFGGLMFTILLRYIEQEIFAENVDNGRYSRYHY